MKARPFFHFNTFSLALLTVILILSGCKTTHEASHLSNDAIILGEFQDDYNINYSITDKIWHLKPDLKYQIIKWDKKQKYIITTNIEESTSNVEYSRIDYVPLKDHAPYLWCYCISAYDKDTAKEAESSLVANTTDLKTGCNGFPFSRMRRLEKNK